MQEIQEEIQEINIHDAIHSVEFEEWYLDKISEFKKYNYNFLGISRKEYPKWAGWKIVKWYIANDYDVNDINDVMLEAQVRNFYYLKYIQELFSSD